MSRVFWAEIEADSRLNHFLLPAIDPAGDDHDEQTPRLQDEFHRRLDGQAKPTRLLEFTDK